MIITKITEQAKNPDRVSIYVDGEFFTGIHKLVAIKFNLKTGMALPETVAQELATLESTNSAWEYSLRSLAVASKSRSRMIAKLTQKFGREKAEETTAKLVDQGLVNDARLAENIVLAQLGNKRKSKAEITALLTERGIAGDNIRNALNLIPENYELETATNLAKAKFQEGSKSIEKIAQYLGRKGFGYSIAKTACAKLGLETEEIG